MRPVEIFEGYQQAIAKALKVQTLLYDIYNRYK